MPGATGSRPRRRSRLQSRSSGSGPRAPDFGCDRVGSGGGEAGNRERRRSVPHSQSPRDSRGVRRASPPLLCGGRLRPPGLGLLSTGFKSVPRAQRDLGKWWHFVRRTYTCQVRGGGPRTPRPLDCGARGTGEASAPPSAGHVPGAGTRLFPRIFAHL
nr:uncharacterized protein LOC104651753 [Saimiri boliviensis boliviensis]